MEMKEEIISSRLEYWAWYPESKATTDTYDNLTDAVNASIALEHEAGDKDLGRRELYMQKITTVKITAP